MYSQLPCLIQLEISSNNLSVAHLKKELAISNSTLSFPSVRQTTLGIALPHPSNLLHLELTYISKSGSLHFILLIQALKLSQSTFFAQSLRLLPTLFRKYPYFLSSLHLLTQIPFSSDLISQHSDFFEQRESQPTS